MSTKKQSKLLVIVIAAIASTGGLLFGFDTGVISGALPFLKESWGGLSPGQLEWVTACVLIGAVLGAFGAGRISDIIGRKKVILVTSLIFAVGSLLTGAAPNLTFLIISRIILGIAIGISSFAVPLYISEISPTKIRGALVSSFQLMITIGIVASYFSDLAFANEADPFSWRWMFYVGIFPALILFTGMIFLPETPRFLIGKGKEIEGKKILRKIEDEDKVDQAFKEIKTEIEKDKDSVGYTEMFKKTWRIPLFIAVGIMFVQQFVGINTVIYYAPTIFIISGFAGAKAAIAATVLVGIVNVLSTVVSMAVIDRIGRRKLYFIGLAGMFVALAALGTFFIMKDSLGASLKWVTVVTVLAYIFFFAISLGPLGWLIISEIFPTRVRGVGMSIGALSNWFFNAIVAFTFLKLAWGLTSDGQEIVKATTHRAETLVEATEIINQEFGRTSEYYYWDQASGDIMERQANPGGAFIVYALIAIVGILWGIKYIPETKGVSLEQIEEHWRQGKKPNELTRM
jgi:sugar porter (SP) family MFS transporter